MKPKSKHKQKKTVQTKEIKRIIAMESVFSTHEAPHSLCISIVRS